MIYKIADNFSMHCDNPTEKYRCDTFWTKESETIAWINSFKEDGIFIDVGANIGLYSCYAAALYPIMEIHAFEAMPLNHLRLMENVQLNDNTFIEIYNKAIGHHTCKAELYIPENFTGASGAQVGNPMDEHGEAFVPQKTYDMQQVSLDDFCAIQEIKPTYIKIDIDGHELGVVRGMDRLIKDKIPESILIEVNKDKTDAGLLIQYFAENGYGIDNEFNKHPNHSRLRRGGDPENIIFAR